MKAMLEQAANLVDSSADNMMIITLFNEWHKDSQIEPNRQAKKSLIRMIVQVVRTTRWVLSMKYTALAI